MQPLFGRIGLHFFQIFRKVCCVLLHSLYVKPEDTLRRTGNSLAYAIKQISEIDYTIFCKKVKIFL